ncbi:FAD:protein FMN transferase [Actibacterium sp. 188UL27-1]|uniref:FAD:protein FMN transferase n=1 Tax=Actibacterium sp. 188UL27-1 TaxID=2786961 RepID=UPI00195B2302|nr:FAD:protein FMN transferase [Actibacterium sp. 188UL27-1]MBM7066167.1 FAD:protein FMN transferase [Actibacterium sp. 188UL27-1]
MKLSRRRFLAISAACTATGLRAAARPHRWHGRALGAEAQIILHGPNDLAQAALAAAHDRIRAVEAEFTLYDPASSLSRLNTQGRLDPLPQLWAPLLDVVDLAHRVTGGLFDPTVQPLWAGLAGKAPLPSTSVIGWDRVRRDPLGLQIGQALTFNGIAQGYATDLVTKELEERGFDRTLVNIGEYCGRGQDWKIGISDPDHGLVGYRTLQTGALATTSPGALLFSGGQSHVLNPRSPDQSAPWSTVTIEAETATLADALSTALVHADLALIKAVKAQLPMLRQVTVIDQKGDLSTI